MKNKVPPNIERLRVTEGPMASDASFGMNGAFLIPYANDILKVLISDGMEWDHVSVSLEYRQPTWEEMHFVKRLFWDDHETVVQMHPPEARYVNFHPHVLHMWRYQKRGFQYPLPPISMIAPV